MLRVYVSVFPRKHTLKCRGSYVKSPLFTFVQCLSYSSLLPKVEESSVGDTDPLSPRLFQVRVGEDLKIWVGTIGVPWSIPVSKR